MVKSALNILAVFTFIFLDCNPDNIKNESYTGYDLTNPDEVIILPDILHEVSGITIIDSITVACIQDEKGIVFIYNIQKNKIQNQLNFHIKGDYEDIVRVGKTLYILRSDGVLFEISDFESENSRLEFFETGIPAKDNEGLCYDMDNNCLLIACKSKRSIYSFDLATKTLSTKPVFTFDINSLIKFALNNNVKLKTRKTKKDPEPEPVLKFRISAISIHPVTKKIFLISSEDHLLFIFNINGRIEHVEKLNNKMFIQPEGLTFTNNGDMLISNEGKGKSPTILRFDYKK